MNPSRKIWRSGPITCALVAAGGLLLALAPAASAVSKLGKQWTKRCDGFDGGATHLIAAPDMSLYLISDNGPVYRSSDNGTTWTQQTAAFDGASGSTVSGAAADYNGALFIADVNRAVWRSMDEGVSWDKRTSNYGGAEPKGLTVDESNVLYMADHSKDVWSSGDMGASWVRVCIDYGGTGTMPAGITYDAGTGGLYITDVNKSIYSSAHAGAGWNKETVSYGGANPDGGITSDNRGRLYIADAKEDVWVSSDGGSNWVRLTNDYGGGKPLAIVGGPRRRLFILDSDGAVWMSNFWMLVGWREVRNLDPATQTASP